MNSKINPSDYEHPTDRTALAALQRVPLLDKVLSWWLNFNVKTDVLVDYRGNGLEITEKSCPRVWKLKKLALDRLSFDEDIPMFITREWQYNAFATGVDKPVIVLNSGLVEDFSDDELLYIIGHEMGHVKSKHMLYHYMAGTIANWAYNTNVVNAIAMQAIVVALMEWQRKSELTADRAGFIANQNKEACLWGMVRLMGLPENYCDKNRFNFTIQDAIDQYEEIKLENNDSMYKRLIYAYLTSKISHPWTIERINEINKWEGIPRI